MPGGIYIAGGDPNLGPERATTWSIGADFKPEFLPGFHAGLTYYNLEYRDRISTPSRTFYTDPNFRKFIVDNIKCASGTYPGGTGCQVLPVDPNIVWNLIKDVSRVGFPTTVNGPGDLPPIYNVTLLRRANLSVIETEGLDFDTGYRWNRWNTDFAIQVAGNYILKFDQAAAAGASLVDQFLLGQQQARVRGSVLVKHGPLRAFAAANYNGAYRNRYTTTSGALATERIDSYATVDLHLGLKLPDEGLAKNVELSADLDNIFNSNPPYLRSGNGYGGGNILGRVVTVGIHKSF